MCWSENDAATVDAGQGWREIRRQDRLGGSGWQARKAKLKNRIREIAGESR